MAEQYCRTNEARDNVVEGPIFKSGIRIPGISNPSLLTDQELLTYYWYPYIEVDPGVPAPYSQYYRQQISGFQIQATEVVRTISYVQWDIEEVRTAKDQELKATIVEYSANEVASDPRIAEYVENDLEWVSAQQIALVRLTVWDDVAAFNTVRPLVRTFANNYIAASYVKQAERLTAQNLSAREMSLPDRWDQTTLNNFATANKIAADDSSGSQPPTEPINTIRQGIAVRDEGFSRLIIWREARDDPNPALQTTYKMRLFNRRPGDVRNLYSFSYANGGIYLTWRLFEALADGSGAWQLEAFSTEWQYVPGDMSFILSYTANPAVDSEWFTDRIDFPAGVPEIQLRVAWDVA